MATSHIEGGDVEAAFAEADRVIEVELSQHRIANVPMETRGLVADYDDGSGQLTVHAATQSPQGLRIQLATTLEHPLDKVLVLTQDVGGAFGLKGNIFREDFCACIATKQIGRPVKWIEDRNEHLLASGHAREEKISAQVAVTDAGDILGIKAELIMDQGAYPGLPFGASVFPAFITLLLPGPYKVKGYSCDATVVTTNKCTYVAYRGPWAMETWVRERLIDIVAHELGLDPAEVRRRNLQEGAERRSAHHRAQPVAVSRRATPSTGPWSSSTTPRCARISRQPATRAAAWASGSPRSSRPRPDRPRCGSAAGCSAGNRPRSASKPTVR